MRPPLTNGVRYGVDAAGEKICLGARMGRPNRLPVGECPKLYLYRLRFVDGCYDQGGAYWGGPANLYRAVNSPFDDEWVEVFVRADCRQLAKQRVLEIVPKARFLR